MEKKAFMEPEVIRVEYNFSEVIAASGGCSLLYVRSVIGFEEPECLI